MLLSESVEAAVTRAVIIAPLRSKGARRTDFMSLAGRVVSSFGVSGRASAGTSHPSLHVAYDNDCRRNVHQPRPRVGGFRLATLALIMPPRRHPSPPPRATEIDRKSCSKTSCFAFWNSFPGSFERAPGANCCLPSAVLMSALLEVIFPFVLRHGVGKVLCRRHVDHV